MVERFVVVDDGDDDADVMQDESHLDPRNQSDATQGLIRRLILIDLAKGLSRQAVAEKYGKALQTISNIRYQNKDKIEEFAAMIDAKQVDLLVSQTYTAVMGFEKQIAELEEEADAMRAGTRNWDATAYAKMQQLIAQIRKMQLEILHPKGSKNGEESVLKIKYTGVDLKKLLEREGISVDD